MADAAKLDVDEAPPPKKGKKGLLIGLVAMLLLLCCVGLRADAHGPTVGLHTGGSLCFEP